MFDTKCCDWGNNTLFNEYLMYKENLLLLKAATVREKAPLQKSSA